MINEFECQRALKIFICTQRDKKTAKLSYIVYYLLIHTNISRIQPRYKLRDLCRSKHYLDTYENSFIHWFNIRLSPKSSGGRTVGWTCGVTHGLPGGITGPITRSDYRVIEQVVEQVV